MKIASMSRPSKATAHGLKAHAHDWQSRAQDKMPGRSRSQSFGRKLRRPDWHQMQMPKGKLPRRGSRPVPTNRAKKLIGAGVLAAAVGYFLDPTKGARRRYLMLHKITSTVIGAFRKMTAIAGRGEATAPIDQSQTEVETAGLTSDAPNDQELAHRVQSELFRDPAVPKGQININAEEGVVYLRGTIESEKQSEMLGSRASEIDGVVGVKNLLHAGSPS